MNYRSVVCFGAARLITDASEKATLFEQMTQRYFPGRTAGRDYDPAPASHLRSTALVEVQIEEWSAKARRGGPKGPKDALPEAPGTCGVIELREPS
jgi:nitroimidazol reductase NimA-like FMN-containing flavoprotein (pyridoxamine 5'-phosphate oxidase superfamily)